MEEDDEELNLSYFQAWKAKRREDDVIERRYKSMAKKVHKRQLLAPYRATHTGRVFDNNPRQARLVKQFDAYNAITANPNAWPDIEPLDRIQIVKEAQNISQVYAQHETARTNLLLSRPQEERVEVMKLSAKSSIPTYHGRDWLNVRQEMQRKQAAINSTDRDPIVFYLKNRQQVWNNLNDRTVKLPITMDEDNLSST